MKTPGEKAPILTGQQHVVRIVQRDGIPVSRCTTLAVNLNKESNQTSKFSLNEVHIGGSAPDIRSVASHRGPPLFNTEQGQSPKWVISRCQWWLELPILVSGETR
jgi:hypothetical protein